MTELKIGQTYKLVDPNKNTEIADALQYGWLKLPSNGLITITSLASDFRGQVMGGSATEGVECEVTTPEGHPFAISDKAVEDGAFELINNQLEKVMSKFKVGDTVTQDAAYIASNPPALVLVMRDISNDKEYTITEVFETGSEEEPLGVAVVDDAGDTIRVPEGAFQLATVSEH